MSENCLFCKIVEGKIPSKKVYEDELIYIFMDINPVHYGHVLIIPKKHRQWFEEMTDEESTAVFRMAKKISGLLRTNEVVKKELNVTATNIILFNGEDAGQEVFHSHCHIVPRHKKDGFLKLKYNPVKTCPKFGTKDCDEHMKNLESHAKLIKSHLEFEEKEVISKVDYKI